MADSDKGNHVNEAEEESIDSHSDDDPQKAEMLMNTKKGDMGGSHMMDEDNEEDDDKEEMENDREPTPSGQKLDKNKAKIQDADRQRLKVEEYSKKIREIHKHWIETEKPWEDPDFPPFNASIFKDQAKLQEMVKEFKNWKWQRPHEINKDITVTTV